MLVTVNIIKNSTDPISRLATGSLLTDLKNLFKTKLSRDCRRDQFLAITTSLANSQLPINTTAMPLKCPSTNASSRKPQRKLVAPCFIPSKVGERVDFYSSISTLTNRKPWKSLTISELI